jgi:purine-cytosine permease-like protein
MGKQVPRRGQVRGLRAADAAMSKPEEARQEAASLRRAILWSAAAFLAVAVTGLLVVPGLRFLWIVLLIFGIAAVPQAFSRKR